MNWSIFTLCNPSFVRHVKALKATLINSNNGDIPVYCACINIPDEEIKDLESAGINTMKFYGCLSSNIKQRNQGKDINRSLNYIKPIIIKALCQEFNIDKFLFLDADTMVRKSLDPLFRYTEDNPLFCRESSFFMPNRLAPTLNSLRLYDVLGLDIDECDLWAASINSGVLGLIHSRDVEIIDAWISITNLVFTIGIDKCNDLIAFWDQGLLVAAMEVLGNKRVVCPDMGWNQYTGATHISNSFIETFKNSRATILHAQGPNKTSESNINMVSSPPILSKDTTIIMCGHRDEYPVDVLKRDYLKYVNMSKIPFKKNEWSDNIYGEARIFISSYIDTLKSEFIGFVTPSWNTKYGEKHFAIDYSHLEDSILNQNEGQIISATAMNVEQFRRTARWLHYPSDHVEDKIYSFLKKYGIKANKNIKVPIANQVICHRDLLKEACSFSQLIADELREEFINIYYNVPEQRRKLAYIFEEIMINWWSTIIKERGLEVICFGSPSIEWSETALVGRLNLSKSYSSDMHDINIIIDGTYKKDNQDE